MTAAIASGHPATTHAGAELLRAGGNAFDAACAAGFASAVVEPALTSLGGGGFLLACRSERPPTLFDFFVDNPGRGRDLAGLERHFFPVTVHFGVTDQDFNVGRGAVAVPGVLAGLLHVHERLGRLPLAEVARPAVHLARNGIELSPQQAYFLEILNPIFTLDPAARAVYTRDGEPLAPGQRLRNPDLAAFLEGLPGSAHAFYEGDVAAAIERDLRDDGLLNRNDLAGYRVHEREPLEVPYRDTLLVTNPPPSFGGSLLSLSLELTSRHPPCADGWGSPAHVVATVELQREVEALRAQGVGSAAALRSFVRGTTHVSVADAEGNVASMTTSNGEGSGYVAPGTGIMLNNMLGEDDLHPHGFEASPPGERVASMMSPSVLLRDGRVACVLGSGGSKRIRTAIQQVLTQWVDFRRGLREAVEAPRLHWDGECVQVEPGYPAASLDALRERYAVEVWPEHNVYFGGLHAVTPTGEAAGDPRRGGAVAILPAP